jgi:DNA-binding GntR family transcriptional regulator
MENFTRFMQKMIDREKPQNLYSQLYDILKNKIDSGELVVGSQIPTEEELCITYGVSKATVRTAILDLVRDGYLMRRQGRGTFVCKRVISEGLLMHTSFKELMLDAGVSFSTKVLAQTVMMPTDDLDLKLNVPEDKHLIYLKRLMLVENEPVLLQEAYIPHHICPKLLRDDIENNSLFEIIENKYELKITKVKDYIEVVTPSADEIKLLGLSDCTGALLLEQHFYSGDTQIMYMRSVKKPERFRFLIEFERKS